METQPTPKSVEDYVNGVSYSPPGPLEDPYIPSPFALHFINFIKLVNGADGEENKSPVLHLKMLDQVPGKKQDLINMVHRGAAKTTLLGEYLFLYLAVYENIPQFGVVDFAIYVSDSIDNGVKNMGKNLRFRWENSEFLQRYVPKVRITESEWEFTNINGKTLVVKGYGAKTGVRGAKSQGKRPVLAVLDDLISDEDARSATVIASVEDTVYKAVDYALHPNKRKIVWSGTPFNSKDPLYKAVESGAWLVNVYPVCEKFPCTREEFRGSWPDRFNYDYVNRQYQKALKSGKVDTFNQELMLRIMSDEDRLIQDHEIQWYKRDTLMRNRGNFNFYITTDFATSENTASDYSVISVWAYGSDGSWYWVDGVCAKQLMDANIDDLFRLAQMYQPQQVGVEISGQQKGFIPWIKEQMLVRSVFFNLAKDTGSKQEGIRPSTNKLTRFHIMVPQFKLGKMNFPEEMKTTLPMREMVDEVSLMSLKGSKSKHDDFLDTISMLANLTPWKPGKEDISFKQDPSGVWAIDDEEEEYGKLSSYIV